MMIPLETKLGGEYERDPIVYGGQYPKLSSISMVWISPERAYALRHYTNFRIWIALLRTMLWSCLD
jgi:hypothetical protein